MNRFFSWRRIHRLDESSRRALQVSVRDETNGVAHELSRVQKDYQALQVAYHEACQQEAFVSQRLARYQKLLREKELQNEQEFVVLPQTQEEGTTCNESLQQQQQLELNKRRQKIAADKAALEKVKETHKQIVAECERMRRRMKEYTVKGCELKKMEQECQTFLEIAQEQSSSPVDDEETTTANVARDCEKTRDDDHDHDIELATTRSGDEVVGDASEQLVGA